MRIILLFLVGSGLLFGQIKLFLRDSISPLNAMEGQGTGLSCNQNSQVWRWRQLTTAQGSSTTTMTFTPSNAAEPCHPQTGTTEGNDFLRWISPPLSASVTITANVNWSVGCRESQTAANFGVKPILKRWSRETGGIVSTIIDSAGTVECPTTAALRTVAAAAPTSTTMQVGDRFVVEMPLCGSNSASVACAGGFAANGSRTFDILYGGVAAGTGDSFVNIATHTASFASDTNNARTIISMLLTNWLSGLVYTNMTASSGLCNR